MVSAVVDRGNGGPEPACKKIAYIIKSLHHCRYIAVKMQPLGAQTNGSRVIKNSDSVTYVKFSRPNARIVPLRHVLCLVVQFFSYRIVGCPHAIYKLGCVLGHSCGIRRTLG